jgi:hypothetical protein
MSEHIENLCENGKTEDRSFLKNGFDLLSGLRAQLDELSDTLLDIDAVSGPTDDKLVAKLKADLQEFQPSITMIGQIKSGKTSLVNAIVGRPGLLPADVNPWTSVVTSLHLNVPREADAAIASFQFFNASEWDHLVSNGGRIGELSMRAGADEELQKIHQQITAMRDKTRARLGRKFELLLGQRHDYRHLDDDLMQRYVCLGDDFEDISPKEQQGRFADITKSADLHMTAPNIPLPLCIRDTPGVNDTFMMREQITIKSLRDSRLCVVVLSASQALSSVDMGLIRLISNVKSDGIVIFVNRVDELSDPVNQMPDIRENITATLSKMNGPSQARIVFGSAYWANVALSENVEDIVDDSAAALNSCAKALLETDTPDLTDRELIWNLSGLPELFEVLSERIVEGIGARLLSDIRARAINHVRGMRASCSMTSMRIEGNSIEVIEPAALSALLATLEANAKKRLAASLEGVFESFSTRVDQSHGRFLDRALESLLQHLEQKGENEVWQYSPDGLRTLLRTSYQVMRKNFNTACDTAYLAAAKDIAETYRKTVAVGVEGFDVKPPLAPEVPAPVSLGATIALDLQTSWWNGWWKRRKGYRAYASGFHSLIEAETTPIVGELKDRQARDLKLAAMERLVAFLVEQRAILMDITEKAQISVNDLNALFGIDSQAERAQILDMILEELNHVTEPEAPIETARKAEGAAA